MTNNQNNNFGNNLGNAMGNLKNRIFNSDGNPNSFMDFVDFFGNDYSQNNQNAYPQIDTSLPKYITPNYQTYNFSTFNTSDYVKNTRQNIENILKQKQVTSNDIANIQNTLKKSAQNVFNDYNTLVNAHSTLPETPTWDSVEKSKEIC